MTVGPPARPIRVVVADDHALYRQSLRLVISLDRDIEVVGMAGDGQEALGLVLELRPDVVVLDLQMPRFNGLEAVAAITVQAPEVRVVMLTMSEEPDLLIDALRAGAAGYITKDSPGEAVAEAIRAVHRGSSQLSRTAAATLLTELTLVRGPEPADAGGDLDIRILQRLAAGDSTDEVAAAVGLSEEGVSERTTAMLERLRGSADVRA